MDGAILQYGWSSTNAVYQLLHLSFDVAMYELRSPDFMCLAPVETFADTNILWRTMFTGCGQCVTACLTGALVVAFACSCYNRGIRRGLGDVNAASRGMVA